MSYAKNTWQTGDVVTAEKLNRMEEGIEVASKDPVLDTAKSTGGIGWTDEKTITWDGDTEGRVVVGGGYQRFVKVSELIDFDTDYTVGIKIYDGSDGQETEYNDLIMDDTSYPGMIAISTDGDHMMVAVVYEAGRNPLGFTEEGVYFYKYTESIYYISSFTFNAPDTIHKIDEKYLPEGGFGYTESGNQTDITWDGDTEGKVKHPAVPFYNISNTYISKDSLVGAKILFNDGTEYTISENDVVVSTADGVTLTTISATVWGVATDFVLTVSDDYGTVLPKGTYFVKKTFPVGERYVSSLTYGTPDTIHKIDEKYLPDDYPMVVRINYDWESDAFVADKPYAEIKAALPNVTLLYEENPDTGELHSFQFGLLNPRAEWDGGYRCEYIAFSRSIGNYGTTFGEEEYDEGRISDIYTETFELYSDGTIEQYSGNTFDFPPSSELLLCAQDTNQVMRITVTSDGTISAEPW